MRTFPPDLAANPVLSRWFGVTGTGGMTVRTGKVELGQGAVTAIAALAAAELGVPLAALTVIAGDTVRGPDEGFTAGSMSVEQGGSAMREATARVRVLFAQAAARRLGVPTGTVGMEKGRFSAPGRNTSFDYADLAVEVDLDVDARDLPEPELRGLDGSVFTRLDLPAKLSGAAFIHDLGLPGLCHGRVLRPARPGARLLSIDRRAVQALPGVVAVVVDGSFVGVVAAREDQAEAALDRARQVAVWSAGPDLPALDRENAWMEVAEPVAVAEIIRDDDPEPAASIRHHAAYSRPYLAHASLAPSCAAASWQDGRVSVWTHAQGVFPLRRQLAAALGCAVGQVDVTHRMGAGCYGHNGADDVALDAALLARGAGVPVLCRWSRADEMVWSPFGAAMRVRLSAGLDAAGRIVDWSHDVFSPPHVGRPGSGGGVDLLAAWHLADPHSPSPPRLSPGPAGTGERNAVPLYDLPRRRVTHHLLPQGPLRSSALRTLGGHANVFAIENFMDELAELAGQDPLAFRLAHLRDPRARAVLLEAAAGWDPAERGGEGTGRGLGFARYKNHAAYCAVMARVEVDRDVRVVTVRAAVDCGAVVHRDGLVNQIEGGVVQATSWTLKEEVRWSADGVTTGSWADYPILGFRECPAIVVRALDRPDLPSLGAGECAAGPTSAAIGNAVAHALGVRVRHMPITSDRIAAAIAALPA